MTTDFEIIVSGSLPGGWASVYSELNVSWQENGTTTIIGTFPDQAALYGLLLSLRDWGLALISVTPVCQQGGESGEGCP